PLAPGHCCALPGAHVGRRRTQSIHAAAYLVFAYSFFTLETTLTPPPQDAWTHYDVPLDDPSIWTTRAPDGGTHPATASELRTAIDSRPLWIRGGDEASIDNLSVELHH